MKEIKIRSINEWKFRLRQYLWNRADHIRCMKWHWRDAPDIRRGAEFNDIIDGKLLENATEIVKERFDDYVQQIIYQAENVCEKKYDLLGYEKIVPEKSNRIDWHYDPIHDKTAPNIWWDKINCSEYNIVGDPKIIWELNRHQHFIILGLAHRLSGNKKYKIEYLNQLCSWLEANPPKYGINWTSSLELAYRSISWIWSFYLFDQGDGIPGEILSKFQSAIIIQGEHIEHNLSTYFSPNTHLTGEALGLFYIGNFIRGDKRYEKWKKIGKDILIEELDKHVLSDGGYFERSLWYHRYTLEIYLHFYLLIKQCDSEIADRVLKKVEKIAEFLMYSSCPDRTFPLIGDDDGGRLPSISIQRGNDLRGLFSTLAVIFKRSDFKYISEGFHEETLFLLGPESLKEYEEILAREPLSTSKGYEETGYYFMRDSWAGHANYLAFDCGPHGWLNCGHAHADLLSFHLVSGKNKVIIDPGTYSYNGEYRDYFRKADAHSLIIVDGAYPAVTGGPFQWSLIPEYKFYKWETNNKYDYVSGCLDSPIHWKHVRELLFMKPDLFIILDNIIGSAMHEIEARFHLYGERWLLDGNKCVSMDGDAHYTITNLGCEDSKTFMIDSWMSEIYGDKKPSKMLIYKIKTDLPTDLMFFISLNKSKIIGERIIADVSDLLKHLRTEELNQILNEGKVRNF